MNALNIAQELIRNPDAHVSAKLAIAAQKLIRSFADKSDVDAFMDVYKTETVK